ncbi:MAG: ABC transporter permease [Lachnospiraceae bacterium]
MYTNQTSDCSPAQLCYQTSLKRQKTRIRLARFFLLVSFLGLWEISANLGWIDSYIFSSPSRLVVCFLSMVKDKSIFLHIGVTLAETLISFVLVMGVSLLLAVLLFFCRDAFSVLEPTLVVLNSLPKSALAPLFIVWLGGNMKTIILTGISVAVFGSVLSLCTSFFQTDPEKEKLLRALGAKNPAIFRLLVLPANIEVLLNLMKVNIGLCLVGVVIGEFISSRCGLGYLIIYGSQVFKLSWVILSIFLLCLIAIGLYELVTLLEKIYRASCKKS